MSTTVKELSEAIKTAATELDSVGTYYVRFANGTQICAGYADIPSAVPATSGGAVQCSFPVAFASADYLAVIGENISGPYYSNVVMSVGIQTTGGCTVLYWNNGGIATELNPHRAIVIAIGKWK